MSKQYWGFSIDRFVEESWAHIERHQDGKSGHYVGILAESKAQAVESFLARLRPFVAEQMYESDEDGYELEEEA